MAATDDLTERLDLARRALDDLLDEVANVGPWSEHAPGDFRMRFDLRPKDLDPDGRIAPSTGWYARVSAAYPDGEIDILPASDTGITDTFPHQLPNDDIAQPWRSGKVCLVDVVPGRELAGARDEPLGTYERLRWHVARTIEWLQRASRNELLMDGDPFELPAFGQMRIDERTVVFSEDEETFGAWNRTEKTFGIADVCQVPTGGDLPVMAVTAWRDVQKRLLLEPRWGVRIQETKATETAIWFRFPRLLVRPPWRAPQTWQQIHDYATEQGIDFEDLLRRATSAIRDGKWHYVLVGFPVAQIMGEPPNRYAWVAFRLPPLKSAKASKTSIPGFRTAVAAPMTDRRSGALAGDLEIGWLRSENWSPEEISARGRFTEGLGNRRIALLGAGALGAALGPLLVRAGVHDLVIFDGGVVEIGNLARHELGVPQIGSKKALELAARLNELTPSARVVGYATPFPPVDGGAREALERADLIVDATASERVIRALGSYPWPAPRQFASASFSFAAESLYLFLAEGPAFPADDFMATLTPWIKADERSPEEFPHEGTGCWSTVFPARADDVALLAAIAVRQMDDHLGALTSVRQFVVYGREADGTVRILDEPRART